jgi:hypothetical protein
MNSELKNRLLANVIQGTKPAPLAFRRRKRSLVSPSGMITAVILIMAFLGLIMLLLSKVQPLF